MEILGGLMKTNLLVLAFRNLGRHKVKTIITTLSIVLCIWSYIVMDAFLMGSTIDSMRNILNLETGAAKIYSKEYFKNKEDLPLYEAFTGWEEIVDELNQKGYIACPKVTFSGTLLFNNKELPFIFNGLDDTKSREVFQLHRYMESGNYVTNGKFELVIGSKGAYDLGVKLGDTINLYTTIDQKNESGKVVRTSQVIPLKIGGIINTTNPYINNRMAFLPIDILNDELLGLRLGGAVTEIAIRKKGFSPSALSVREESPSVISKEIGNILTDDLTVVSWREDAKDFIAMSDQDKSGTAVLLLFLIVLTVIGISNTMLMATLERTKEIGMTRALGMTDSEIFVSFVIEAAMIGFIGAIVGLIVSIPFNIYMVNVGIDFSNTLEAFGTDEIGYRLVGIYKSAWNWGNAFLSIFIATLVAALASIIPVLRAVKIPIVEALRFE